MIDILTDAIKTMMYVSMGFILGFVVGLLAGISNLYELMSVMPDWMTAGFILTGGAGCYFFIAMLSNNDLKIEKVKGK